MKKILTLFAISSLVAFAACSGGDEVPPQVEELVKTVNVRTATVTPATFNSFVRVVGTVETPDDIMISAEVSGKVLRYMVEEGEVARAGQTILKIDDAKLTQEMARLEAMTAQSRESYERLKKVYEEDGIGSELDYLNAKYAYEQNKSALESIKVDVANTNIKAPFTGRVEQIMYEVGEMVAPGSQTVRLIGEENFQIVSGIPARYSDAVNIGEQVDIWFDTQDADTLREEVTFIGKSINPQNRTFRIEIDLPETRTMKVDMIANIRLNTLQRDSVIVVSEEFVYSKDGKYVTYVAAIDGSGKPVAKEKVVVLGPSYKSSVIIESGLTLGDELITIGSAFLNNGMKINVVESNTALAAQ